MYTRTAGVTKTARHDYKGRGLPFDQQTVQRRKKGECPLRLNESRWTARGVSSRLRNDQRGSLTQPLKTPTVLAVARAAPAIVWVACPAVVVGANGNGLLSAYSWKR